MFQWSQLVFSFVCCLTISDLQYPELPCGHRHSRSWRGLSFTRGHQSPHFTPLLLSIPYHFLLTQSHARPWHKTLISEYRAERERRASKTLIFPSMVQPPPLRRSGPTLSLSHRFSLPWSATEPCEMIVIGSFPIRCLFPWSGILYAVSDPRLSALQTN